MLFVILAIIWLLASQQKNTNEEQLQETTREESKLPPKLDKKNTSVETALKELPVSHLQCIQFTNEFNKSTRKWQVNMQENAAYWLKEGYSLDEIAYAIEYFRNRNFAQSWFVGHLLKDSRVVKENQTLTNRFMKLMGSDSPLPLQIEKKFPIKNLIGYKNMSKEERQDALALEPPTVDDIVAFIKSKELSQQEIVELLSYVENPKEIIASAGARAPIYLLEYATASRMYDVVEALLQAGAEPMPDGYLKNALEIALYSLFLDLSKSKDVSEHISLINKLAEFNLTARHHMLDNGTIKPWSLVLSYSFDNETVLKIEKDYGLDLISIGRPIEEREKLLNAQLISQLEQQKIELLASEYDNLPYEEVLQNCKTLEEKISHVWQQPLSIYTDKNQKLLTRYAEDANAVNAELALRDPDYIDCFRKAFRNQRIYAEDQTELSKAYFSMPHYGQEWFSKFIQSRDFSEAEMTWIFYTTLSTSNIKDVKTLTELGFIPTHLDYQKFRWYKIQQTEIQYLNSKGFDTKSVDRYGKNMLYFAVESKRVDLIKYMLAEHYPFNISQGSQDPLHLLLASWKRGYSKSFALEMLPIIMSFQPEINEFHLARMKLLELRDNVFYLKIIEQFPELTTNDKTPYPDAACR